MSNDEKNALLNTAHEHAKNLADDIQNASTRVEHMRLTRLALEAQRLADRLDALLV